MIGVCDKTAALESTVQQHSDQLTRLKRQLRCGFTSLHDSIVEVQRVIEARRQLLQQQLRREMRTTYAKLVSLQ